MLSPSPCPGDIARWCAVSVVSEPGRVGTWLHRNLVVPELGREAYSGLGQHWRQCPGYAATALAMSDSASAAEPHPSVFTHLPGSRSLSCSKKCSHSFPVSSPIIPTS